MTMFLPLSASVLAIALLLAPQRPDPVAVPLAAAPQVDGRFTAGEWDEGAAFTFADGTELRLQHDGEFLYVGLRAEREILGSLCLLRGDTVEVLHASMALGRAVYARAAYGWARVEGFRYGMRETDDTPETLAKRAAYLAEHGWIANTTPMGEPGVREYRIATGRLDGASFRLGVAHLAMGDEPLRAHGWPELDDCAALDLVRGDSPERLQFRPEAWAELVLDDA